MSLQESVAVRNARLDAQEVTIGTSPVLQLRSGPPPANCATADSGTLLASLTLPSDWMAAASGGVKSKTGTWSGTGAAAGTAAHFRVKDSGLTATHYQGTATATGGGGDMTLDNAVIANGQAITVTSFDITAGNA
jgi:hypothetical protein